MPSNKPFGRDINIHIANDDDVKTFCSKFGFHVDNGCVAIINGKTINSVNSKSGSAMSPMVFQNCYSNTPSDLTSSCVNSDAEIFPHLSITFGTMGNPSTPIS